MVAWRPAHIALFLSLAVVFVWSVIEPYDRFTWWLEAAPVIVAVSLLLLTFRRFPLTMVAYVCIWLHSVILLVGAHYTYAEVPLFHTIREIFDLSRNHYDRLGHLAQGFFPAIIIQELLLRTSPLKRGKWMVAIVVFSCLGISALYEVIEWLAAAGTGEAANAFLGTQGDVWDTQKDMALAGVGAMLAMATLGSVHARAVKCLV